MAEIRFDTTTTQKRKCPPRLEGHGGHFYPISANPEQSGDVVAPTTTNALRLV
jgi:hypothetical protein